MAVPSGNSHLKNTTGGAFSAQKQGGTVLGNTTAGDVVTKVLALKDNAADFGRAPVPVQRANGLVANQKVLSGGTFAYQAEGNYVIRTISSTISGVAKTNVLIPGSDSNTRRSIHQFEHAFGSKTVTKYRANQYTLTGTLNSGATNASRIIWLNSAGNAAEAPAALNENMYDISDGNATDRAADSAANPTRAIPGELVLKVDFVTTSVSSGGDFFDYKPITGK
jgi:hypothetical protein